MSCPFISTLQTEMLWARVKHHPPHPHGLFQSIVTTTKKSARVSRNFSNYEVTHIYTKFELNFIVPLVQLPTIDELYDHFVRSGVTYPMGEP
jgi:hypothetical protein